MSESFFKQAAPTDALRIDRHVEPIRWVLRVMGVIVLTVMITTPALQVFMRQIVGLPMIGSEELTRFMLICTVMLTVPYTISSGASIRMDELLLALPISLGRAVTVLIAVCGLAAFAFAFVAVGTATLRNLNNFTPTLRIPYYIFFSAAAIGFLMAAVEFGIIAYKAIIGRPLYVVFEAEQSNEELVL